jgi:hypothetical protein
MQRITFNVSTDTGGKSGDTGPSIWGELKQIRWVPTTTDTGGADLVLTQLMVDGDTSGGWDFYAGVDSLAGAFTKSLRVTTHDKTGIADMTDTGTPASPTEVVFAGEKIRMKVTPGGTAIAGKLYLWINDNA